MLLQSILENVPQNPLHHPEGNVWNHSQLVRKHLDFAIEQIGKVMNESPCFSAFDPVFSKRERNILRSASYFHDIGKVSATTFSEEKGYRAIGHEELSHICSGLGKLRTSPIWGGMLDNSSHEDIGIMIFIIRHHMFRFSKRFQNKYISDEGVYDPKVKLLITFRIMDQLGRGFDVPRFDLLAAVEAAEQKKRRAAHIQDNQNQPDNPVEFVAYAKEKELSAKIIRMALEGKRRKGLPNFVGLSDVDIDNFLVH